jgi:hypothetical protein
MTRMPHFDAIESVRCQARESFARTVAARMCPHGERTSGVGDADCVSDIEARLGYVRGLARAEETVERIAVIRGEAVTNKYARDMRPAQCTTRSFRYDVVEADRSAGLRETFYDTPSTLDTLALKSLERRPDRARVGDVQREHVNFHVAVVSAELATSHDTDADRRSRRNCFIVSGNSIVIGDRDREELGAGGGLDEFSW